MAKFNIEITVPDDKIDDLKQMIDDRLNNQFSKERVTTDEEGNETINYNYQDWLGVILSEYIKANYKGWKKSQLQKQNQDSIETETENLIS